MTIDRDADCKLIIKHNKKTVTLLGRESTDCIGLPICKDCPYAEWLDYPNKVKCKCKTGECFYNFV